jgi:hypothetical protein
MARIAPTDRRCVEYVPIGGQEPNYDATLAALKELSV